MRVSFLFNQKSSYQYELHFPVFLKNDSNEVVGINSEKNIFLYHIIHELNLSKLFTLVIFFCTFEILWKTSNITYQPFMQLIFFKYKWKKLSRNYLIYESYCLFKCNGSNSKLNWIDPLPKCYVLFQISNELS